MASSNPSCSRRHCLPLRKNKPCFLVFRHLLAFLVVGHFIIQNGVVFCADQPEPEMSCYACDQSGSEAGGENDDDLCINPNPASDENPSTTLACPESDNKCASIRLVHHYAENIAVFNLGAETVHQNKEEKDDEDKLVKIVEQAARTFEKDEEIKADEIKQQKDDKIDLNDIKKEPEVKHDKEDKKDDEKEDNGEVEHKKERQVTIGKEDKKDIDPEDEGEDERKKRSSLAGGARRKRRSLGGSERRERSFVGGKRRNKRSPGGGGDISFVEIARKGCTSEKRVKAALDCFRNLFHHPYQRYLGKCTVTQFGREGFLMIKQKCEPGTLPKDMRIDTDRQDKFYLLLCTCEGDLCNDKELLELDKRVFIPEVKVVGNGTPWDEGWGRLGSGGGRDDDDDDDAMRKKFKSGGEIKRVCGVLLLVAIGVLVTRGRF